MKTIVCGTYIFGIFERSQNNSYRPVRFRGHGQQNGFYAVVPRDGRDQSTPLHQHPPGVFDLKARTNHFAHSCAVSGSNKLRPRVYCPCSHHDFYLLLFFLPWLSVSVRPDHVFFDLHAERSVTIDNRNKSACSRSFARTPCGGANKRNSPRGGFPGIATESRGGY